MFCRFKYYVQSFIHKDDGVSFLELCLLLIAITIFLGIAIPGLLESFGGVFSRLNTKFEGFLQ